MSLETICHLLLIETRAERIFDRQRGSLFLLVLEFSSGDKNEDIVTD